MILMRRFIPKKMREGNFAKKKKENLRRDHDPPETRTQLRTTYTICIRKTNKRAAPQGHRPLPPIPGPLVYSFIKKSRIFCVPKKLK
jgi:hypothetical protein